MNKVFSGLLAVAGMVVVGASAQAAPGMGFGLTRSAPAAVEQAQFVPVPVPVYRRPHHWRDWHRGDYDRGRRFSDDRRRDGDWHHHGRPYWQR